MTWDIACSPLSGVGFRSIRMLNPACSSVVIGRGAVRLEFGRPESDRFRDTEIALQVGLAIRVDLWQTRCLKEAHMRWKEIVQDASLTKPEGFEGVPETVTRAFFRGLDDVKHGRTIPVQSALAE